MGTLKNLMARRCDRCPFCQYARKHPDSTFGKVMAWHGKFCPFWRAWEEVYGNRGATRPEATR